MRRSQWSEDGLLNHLPGSVTAEHRTRQPYPAATDRSKPLTEAASTSTRTSPAAGSGCGTSWTAGWVSRAVMANAFMVVPSLGG